MSGHCPALQELWPAEEDTNTWEGVTYGDASEDGDGVRRVVRLELNDKLSDAVEVPEELGSLTALKVLLLQDNRLSSLPAAFGGLGSLRELYLENNRLTEVPAEIGGLGALEKLALDGNVLTRVPANLGGLTALNTL